MKCVNCGADIAPNTMKCIYCGHMVQMVPDYNPLGDILEQEVRNRIEGNEPVTETRERGNTRKRDAERRRALKRKRRNVVIGLLAGVTVLVILISYFIYANSYTGQMNAGYGAYKDGDYPDAIHHYENAMEKKPTREEPYDRLLVVYTAIDNTDKIEETYLSALKYLSENIELNISLMEFYVKTEQQHKITEYLKNIKDNNVQGALAIYESHVPEFSLESGTFDDVQEVTIVADSKRIYYTTDGSTPSQESIPYEGAIQLSEGLTEVKAVAVNDKGVVSDITYGEYIIKLPTPDAPIVSPSTGQYKEETYIKVQVPEGATAYYTTDSSHPYANGKPGNTASKYKAPIKMQEGNTIISVVVVSGSGKVSQITMRNYDLVIEKVEEQVEELDELDSEDQ